MGSQIFDEFSIGKKSSKNLQFGVRGSRKGVPGGAVGGQGGVGKRLWSQQNPISRFNTPSAPQAGAADPNAPSGASTAAPVFVARRLVQLLAFCDRRFVGRNFDYFLQFLAVLSGSWLLSCRTLWQAVFGRLLLEMRRTCSPNNAKMMPKTIRLHEESIPNQ